MQQNIRLPLFQQRMISIQHGDALLRQLPCATKGLGHAALLQMLNLRHRAIPRLQVWQLLPLGPPDPMFFSPYSSTDANCGNPFMISTDELVKDGLLEQHEQPAQVSSKQG